MRSILVSAVPLEGSSNIESTSDRVSGTKEYMKVAPKNRVLFLFFKITETSFVPFCLSVTLPEIAVTVPDETKFFLPKFLILNVLRFSEFISKHVLDAGGSIIKLVDDDGLEVGEIEIELVGDVLVLDSGELDVLELAELEMVEDDDVDGEDVDEIEGVADSDGVGVEELEGVDDSDGEGVGELEDERDVDAEGEIEGDSEIEEDGVEDEDAVDDCEAEGFVDDDGVSLIDGVTDIVGVDVSDADGLVDGEFEVEGVDVTDAEGLIDDETEVEGVDVIEGETDIDGLTDDDDDADDDADTEGDEVTETLLDGVGDGSSTTIRGHSAPVSTYSRTVNICLQLTALSVARYHPSHTLKYSSVGPAPTRLIENRPPRGILLGIVAWTGSMPALQYG